MKTSRWTVVACVVAMLGVTACSDTDDVVNLPVTAQAEAAIESVLADVLEPLGDFVNGMAEAVINGQPKGPSLVCPLDTGTCGSGSVVCDEDSSGIGLEFDFNQCNVTQAGVVADGGVNIVPTGSYAFTVNLVDFTLDGGDPMNGPMDLDLPACTEAWYIDATSAFIAGSAKACDDDYPDAQSTLVITVGSSSDIWIFYFSFDGSNIADVLVERNQEVVSTCEVDLDTYATTCVPAEPI